MKWYIKVELILEVESKDLWNEIWMIEDWVLDELNETTIHKDIKIVEKTIDALQFKKWIDDWFDDLY